MKDYLLSYWVGCQIGVEMLHIMTNKKAPIWACWIFGICTMPINYLIYLGMLLVKGYKWTTKYWKNAIIEIFEEAN